MSDIYSVVLFGCNSSPSDMWIPMTYIFYDKEEAYTFYHKNAPSLNDKYKRASHYTGSKTGDYLEAIVQDPGFHYNEEDCYAKRPEGAVISKHVVQAPSVKLQAPSVKPQAPSVKPEAPKPHAPLVKPQSKKIQ